jgi:hypothetical protein
MSRRTTRGMTLVTFTTGRVDHDRGRRQPTRVMLPFARGGHFYAMGASLVTRTRRVNDDYFRIRRTTS